MPKEKAMVGPWRHRTDKYLHLKLQEGNRFKKSPHPTWLSGGRYKDSNGKEQSKRFHICRMGKKGGLKQDMLVTATIACLNLEEETCLF